MKWLKLTLVFLVCFSDRVKYCNAGRVLGFVFPQYSHLQSISFLAEELQMLGHQLWVAVPSSKASSPLFQNQKMKLASYEALGDLDIDKVCFKSMVDSFLETGLRKHDLRAVSDISNKVLKDENLFNEIRSQKFDFVLVDFTLAPIFAVIPYMLNIPFGYVGVVVDPWASAIPVLPSFIPFTTFPFSSPMNFLQRTKNTLLHLVLMVYNPRYWQSQPSLYISEKEVITMNQLMAKAEIWLFEQDPILDYPRPLMPNTKFVGGLSVKKSKSLAKPFDEFVGQSEHGVVLVTFGGSIPKLPERLFKKLLKAFSQTKYNYIWRTNGTSPDTKKYMLSEWIPQNDILGHPKTKLFITHSGANGQFESLYHGVPMLGLPVFAEQPYNAERMANKGFGIQMDLYQSTAEELTQAIVEIFENPQYKNRIGKASEIFRSKPFSPRQEAAYWIDHVMKYGSSHLRSRGLDLPWYQYLCLDVVLLLISILIFLSYLFVKLVKFICRSVCQSAKPKKE